MTISLLFLLVAWWVNRRAWRLFHALPSWSQRSLIRVQPELAMARPSLRPLTARGWPVVLRMRGLLKIGCLRTSAWNAGSDFARPTLTLSQEPSMLFQNEHFNFLNLGAAKSQFISGMLGPLPYTGRWTWSVRCLRISFQGSPPGARPLTKSLARSASDCALGSIIPRPPLDKGRVRESHLTLAHVLEAFPPPNEVSYHSSDLVAHPRIGVPTGCHIPHWGKQYLVGNKNSTSEREVALAPSDHLPF